MKMKMNISKWLLLHIGISIINQIVFVEADYLVSVRIQDFTTICDDCGTYFRYCIQSLDGGEQCQESHQHVQQGIVLDFSREFLLLRENPMLLRGPTKEWEGVKIYLAALDRNSPQGVNLLTEAHVNLTIDNTQIGVESTHGTYTGLMGHSNITVSFLVTCAENWYGDDCNTWCQHFCMCDLPVPCHDNCVGVECGENRHCVDGVDAYVCTCDQGFTGRRCEINLDECEGVNCSGNGRCSDGVNSFYCDCDTGYSGTLCAEVANTEPFSIGTCNSTSILKLDENTLPYLIAGIIGWILLIMLTTILIISFVFFKLKKKLKRRCLKSNQMTSSFSNGCTQENVSYRAIPPEVGTNISVQMPVGLATTTTVNISHRERERDSSMIYNHAYEKSPEGLYEAIA